jgi:sigma-B regulation protein RsbU (phosphoserine phosphatase)
MSGTSLRRLKLFSFKLNVLLEITQAINENLSQEELLKRYEKILKAELNIGKILIFKHNKIWECILKSGIKSDADIEKIDVYRDLMPIKEITNVTYPQNPYLKNFDVIIPVYNNNAPLAFVLIGDIEEEMAGVSPTIKHLHFIQTLSNIIIVAIENIRLYQESLRQEALRKELEFASQMQSLLIPDPNKLPHNKEISVATYYLPHFEVGGDYYDYLDLGNQNIGFCIADVSGKGISAAIFMSNFQANLRALFTREIALEDLIKKLNTRVMEIANGEKFITLFIARYNKKTKELEYVNAGHNPPILFDATHNKVTYLNEGCIGLGMLDEIPTINKGSYLISGKTKILCYTDGLVEYIHENKIEFDVQEIEQSLRNTYPIDENIDEIIENQNIYKGNSAIFDDISIIGIEISG